MKLSEIKLSLIEHFFSENSNGISKNLLDPIFESLGRSMKIDLSPEVIFEISQKTANDSQDPGKAFKKFTDGRLNILTILEEDGSNTNAIFTAVRAGTHIKFSDLTTSPIVEKVGNLAMIKDALKQAKNRNDEVYFTIISSN